LRKYRQSLHSHWFSSPGRRLSQDRWYTSQMPRPSTTDVKNFVPLTLDELEKELVAVGVPKESALNVAAAAYFYCPLPPVLQSQWSATMSQLRTLAYSMACLQVGDDGVNPDFVPVLRQAARLTEGVKVVLHGDAQPRLIRDGDGNVNALDGVDAEIYASAPIRVRHLFLFLAVEILHQQGAMTKKATYRSIVDVVRLLEGKRIDESSVKRAYLRACHDYKNALPDRQIDLSRIRKVLANQRGRYVPVWREAIKVATTKKFSQERQSADASKCDDGASPSGTAPGGNDSLVRWKPARKWAGPGGIFAKWAQTGEPPTPDELPLALAGSARTRLWFDFDGLSSPPVPRPAQRRQAKGLPGSKKRAPHRSRGNRPRPK
jgi:hypothetical protein